ncbi:hypothetical protein D3C78_817560 [compost metagenome]
MSQAIQQRSTYVTMDVQYRHRSVALEVDDVAERLDGQRFTRTWYTVLTSVRQVRHEQVDFEGWIQPTDRISDHHQIHDVRTIFEVSGQVDCAPACYSRVDVRVYFPARQHFRVSGKRNVDVPTIANQNHVASFSLLHTGYSHPIPPLCKKKKRGDRSPLLIIRRSFASANASSAQAEMR